MSVYFEIVTPLNKKIRTTVSYWNYITRVKHPFMQGKEDIVKHTLSSPDEIRKSSFDESVYLFYKYSQRKYCVVVKIENNSGYIITTYPVDAIKEGELIWKK